MADSVTFHFVRHGATKLNNDTDTSVDRIRGWSDVPLVEEGRQEAREAGKKLSGKGIQIIVSSDLSRARETAEIIGGILGVKPTFNNKLRPWKLGVFTGKSTKEALPKIAEYARKKPNEPVEDGESFNSFVARTKGGLLEALQRAGKRNLLVVSHHRDERLFKSLKPDGSVDIETFLQKGDPPGGILEMTLPMSALKATPAKKKPVYA